MPDSETTYQRLPGRGKRRGSFVQIVATTSRLWLGPDHLLLVDSNGYRETYKRFYFRDIQAVAITRTNRRNAWTIGLLCFGIPFAAIGLSYGGAAFVVCGGIAAVFFLLTGINLQRGPTCVCHLTTAVQTEELASLQREPRARKVLAQIRPLIRAAQEQTVTPESGSDVPADDVSRAASPSPN